MVPGTQHIPCDDNCNRTTVNSTAQQLLPLAREIQERVFRALHIADISKIEQTSCHARDVLKVLRPRVLEQRCFASTWSWKKAHEAEVAFFFLLLGNPHEWIRGPNNKGPLNVLEPGIDKDPHWLWLSGGTDWNLFQGGYRHVSEVGIHPTWISFKVRVAKPEFTGAFLTLAARQHTWGLADPILAFNYNGDERMHRRCFSVQPGATQQGDVSHACVLHPGIKVDVPYHVAINLDWRMKVMSVFIDGIECLNRVPFGASGPIRFIAVYNWRKEARTAFSELMLGNLCPEGVPNNEESNSKLFQGSYLQQPCCCIRRKSNVPETKRLWASGSALLPMRLLYAGATLGLAVVIAQLTGSVPF